MTAWLRLSHVLETGRVMWKLLLLHFSAEKKEMIFTRKCRVEFDGGGTKLLSEQVLLLQCQNMEGL